MSLIDGYSAVVYLRQSSVQALLHAIHTAHGSLFRQSISATVTLAGQPLNITGTVFLEEPIATFAVRSDNTASLALSAYARLALSYAGENVAAALFQLSATVRVAPSFSGLYSALPNQYFDSVLDLSGFTVDSAALTALDLPGSATLHAAALDPGTRQALLDQVRKAAAGLLRITVPTSYLSMLQLQELQQDILVGVLLVPRAIGVADGAVALGWVRSDAGTEPTPPPQAAPPWATYDAQVAPPFGRPGPSSNYADLLVALDASFLTEFVMSNAALQVALRSGDPNLKVTSVDCIAETGKLRLTLSAETNAPDPLPGTVSANLGIDISAFVDSGRVSTSVSNVSVHIDIGFDPLGVFSSPHEADLEKTLAGPSTNIAVDASFGGVVPDLPVADLGVVPLFTTEPEPVRVGIAMQGVALDSGMCLSGGSVTLPITEPLLQIAVLDSAGNLRNPAPVVGIRERFLIFQARHPDLTRDPTLRLRWRILDAMGQSVWQREDWADAVAGPIKLDLWNTPAAFPLPMLTLEAVATRIGTPVLPTATVAVTIKDLLDRSHPYFHHLRTVRWSEPGGTRGGKPFSIWFSELRRSAIHRTALPGRCEFADRFTSSSHRVEYLDVLPPGAAPLLPPAKDTGTFSDRLCPYCFFPFARRQIGPTRASVLSQIAPAIKNRSKRVPRSGQ